MSGHRFQAPSGSSIFLGWLANETSALRRAPAAACFLVVAVQVACASQGAERVHNTGQLAESSAMAAAAPAQHQALVDRYCVRCHDAEKLTGGLSLEAFEVARAEDSAEVAEKVVHKLRAGMMPPRPGRQPDPEAVDALVGFLEARLDRASARSPNPGHRTFQRLNRAEYSAAIRDLLAIEVDADAYLPADTVSQGFDNVADVQGLSATLMEGYLRAADRVSRDAVGDPGAGPTEIAYKVPRTASQLDRVEGAPLGTRGGVSVIHNFPADGQYVFRFELHSTPTGSLFGATSEGEQIELSIDGARKALLDIDPMMSEADPNGMSMSTQPIPIPGGPHRVTAAFVERYQGPADDLIAPIDHTLADTQIGIALGVTTLPHLRDLSIRGPFEVTGISSSPSRRKIFTCRPTTPAEEAPCAQAIVSQLASEAYRRPIEEQDLAGLMTLYRQAAARDGFEAGIRTALQAIVASPHFLFRLEQRPEEIPASGLYPISDIDLASRLSFFLWSTSPDEELRSLAARGRLSHAATFDRQVKRMVRDPRARALSTRFASQWLRLQDLDQIHPDALAYPGFDRTLAEAMKRETLELFDHLVREDKSVVDLLRADYTFVNERLARHYGLPGVAGEHFRKVELVHPGRRGLLGHASVLTLTSHANRTSPVLRGKWVMEVLLGSPPPPPPPDVPDLEATEAIAEGRVLSVRERLEEHRSNPACRSCHRVIDPIGLALETFDVTGAWRRNDGDAAVDPTGQLYDGTPLTGPRDLRQALLERSDVFLHTFTENLLAYGLGRRVGYHDKPAIRTILRHAAANDYRMSSFLLGVVQSQPFRMARAEEEPVAVAAQ